MTCLLGPRTENFQLQSHWVHSFSMSTWTLESCLRKWIHTFDLAPFIVNGPYFIRMRLFSGLIFGWTFSILVALITYGRVTRSTNGATELFGESTMLTKLVVSNPKYSRGNSQHMFFPNELLLPSRLFKLLELDAEGDVGVCRLTFRTY